MTRCYHESCDSAAQNAATPFANMTLYGHVVQTLMDTTVEMTEASCQNSKRSIQSLNMSKDADYFISTCSKRGDTGPCVGIKV